MKQRLALARALLHQPPLLFLDEPTSGLDPEAAQQVNTLIESLSHKGQTIVLCTHNLTEAERLCDRVVVMNRPRLGIGQFGGSVTTTLARHLGGCQVLGSAGRAPIRGGEKFSGAKQVEAEPVSLSVRLESKEDIPSFVRHLVDIRGFDTACQSTGTFS